MPLGRSCRGWLPLPLLRQNESLSSPMARKWPSQSTKPGVWPAPAPRLPSCDLSASRLHLDQARVVGASRKPSLAPGHFRDPHIRVLLPA